MSNYSYSDLQSMQKKAMERVRDMKKASDEVVRSAQRELSVEPKQRSDIVRADSTRVTNMPPNFPKSSQYPTFENYFQQENKKDSSVVQQKPVITENNPEALFKEPDKALLLGLILLLKSENADKNLITALTYILS